MNDEFTLFRSSFIRDCLGLGSVDACHVSFILKATFLRERAVRNDNFTQCKLSFVHKCEVLDEFICGTFNFSSMPLF
jgi:hypothetical protein